MTAEERAAKAAEDLKKKVELGIDDSRPECDRETEVITWGVKVIKNHVIGKFCATLSSFYS